MLGRKAALFGYEHGRMEAWAYPLQILDGFELSFRLEGYPLEIRGSDTSASVEVRPEATVVTYSHAAFTVRQTIFAPLDEPGVVMLFDVDSALPLTVGVSFRPRLKLMWPAGLMTGSLSWDERARAYFITEETGRFVGVIGSPAARDVSVMPYQEEPRDVPAQFRMEAQPSELKSNFLPLVIAGSVRGREEARATYARLLDSARGLYEKNVEHYRRLLEETTSVTTPDARVNEALQWAKVGIDKGVVDNPLLGRGLVAGFRTAGESERPGFAWFFGRDALWTALAVDSYGDYATTRDALAFLKKYQRADGKIPHEISQSASLIPWFTDYPYPWASADATPLYIIAHADYYRATGDLEFLRADWDSILKAYSFAASTDTDANLLVENTKFGHGWVEGGALYPPHEEIYMQGLWVEALESVAEMSAAVGDKGKLREEAAGRADAVREAIERTYWLEGRGFYAFATGLARESPREADPGPNRDARQGRMNELDKSKLWDEDTVLPAVPLWFGVLEEPRAQEEIDHLGSGHIATDWGARILSDESRLYDPLSYHNGSVWPLFTGWASMGAYQYGRPHVGLQALMSNVLLQKQNALGYVTELLSGDFNAPFGRSSHHQVWSEAMTVTPLIRGMLGVDVGGAGKTVTFEPQLPADWRSVEVRRVATGAGPLDISLARGEGQMTIRLRPGGAWDDSRGGVTVELAPALPLDARVRAVKLDGRPLEYELARVGEVLRVEATVQVRRESVVTVAYDEGSDVYVAREAPAPGARSSSLRVLRSEAGPGSLRLLLEGVGGRAYTLRLRTPYAVSEAEGFKAARVAPNEYAVTVGFDAPPEAYARRELVIPLSPPTGRR